MFKRPLRVVSFFVLLLPAIVSPQMGSTVEAAIQKCWEFKYENNADLRLESDRNSVYLRRGDSVIDAVSLDTGKLLWSTDVGGKIESNLLPSKDNLIFVRRSVTSQSGKPEIADVRAISSATGIAKWNTPLLKGSSYSVGIIGDKVLALSADGAMQLFSASDGIESWNRKTNVGLGSTVFDVDRAFFVTTENEIRFVTIGGGESTFVAQNPYAISAFRGVAADKTLIWGDDHGNITSFTLSSNKIDWRFKSGARVNEILRVNGYFIAASNDNFVYALSPDAGTRIWKKRFAGRIQSLIPVGSDSVLVQPVGESKLFLLDAKTGKNESIVSFPDTEEIPLVSISCDNSGFVVLTNTKVYKYSLGECSPGK